VDMYVHDRVLLTGRLGTKTAASIRFSKTVTSRAVSVVRLSQGRHRIVVISCCTKGIHNSDGRHLPMS
jgi:hypothetical protein